MEEMVNKLNEFLADLNVFYRKLQNYHWNVKGKNFFVLHEKLEEYYDKINEEIDEIAEHILTLDKQPLGTMKDYLEKTCIEEAKNAKIEGEIVLDKILNCGSQKENPQPGFEYVMNNANIKDGNHILKIQVLSKEGKILKEYVKNIVIEKYQAKTYIDYPITSIAGDFVFEGWFISNDEKSTYKLYIDDVEQKDINFIRTQRNDVLNFYKEYNTEINKQPGIICNIDSSKISKGKHKLTLKVFSREENLIAEYSTNFTLGDSKAKLYIESPSTNIDVVGKTLNVVGWVMSNDKNTSRLLRRVRVITSGITRRAKNVTP